MSNILYIIDFQCGLRILDPNVRIAVTAEVGEIGQLGTVLK